MKIIQFTTVHSRHDTRIRYKMCDALIKEFPNQVLLLVHDGIGSEIDEDNGLKIYDVGSPYKNRIKRMVLGSWKMYKAVLKERPSIAHFHDPELIPVGIALSFKKIKVIYDSHEDVPKQILSKKYIKNDYIKLFLSSSFGFFEKKSCVFFDHIIGATDSVIQRFPQTKSSSIRNFPRLELIQNSRPVIEDDGKFKIIYAGSLSEQRGILDLVSVIAALPDNFSLYLLGKWADKEIEIMCKEHPGWSKCKYLGRVPHSEVAGFIKSCNLGVQLTHDIPNHQGGLPTKVFEYMFGMIPCLISDTKEKRDFFGDLVFYAKSGNIDEMVKKIISIEKKESERKSLIASAYNYSIKNYSWEMESKKLLYIYNELTK